MFPEKYERQIAMSTEAGREGLAVRDNVLRAMTGEQKVAKALELTETTRQIMREGTRRANPDASEAELQEMFVDRLLRYHGTSLVEIRASKCGALHRRRYRRVGRSACGPGAPHLPERRLVK